MGSKHVQWTVLMRTAASLDRGHWPLRVDVEAREMRGFLKETCGESFGSETHVLSLLHFLLWEDSGPLFCWCEFPSGAFIMG